MTQKNPNYSNKPKVLLETPGLASSHGKCNISQVFRYVYVYRKNVLFYIHSYYIYYSIICFLYSICYLEDLSLLVHIDLPHS